MTKPFDVTLKHMLEDHPADCARLLGIQTTTPIAVIDGDVSTVSAMADKVLRFAEAVPWLLHFEFQASYEADLPERMLRYNVLLNGRHEVPVRSSVLLLRREADGPAMTGTLRQTLPDGQAYLEFRFSVIRVWEIPVEDILRGGVGTLPLAPIAARSEAEAFAAVQRMKERLTAEVSVAEAGMIWAETDILLGLCYSKVFADELLRGVQGMKESVTYQAIVEEGVALGRVAGARDLLLRQGEIRFGPPDPATTAALEAINHVERLQALGERLLQVNSWQELLEKPRPKKPNGRKRKR